MQFHHSALAFSLRLRVEVARSFLRRCFRDLRGHRMSVHSHRTYMHQPWNSGTQNLLGDYLGAIDIDRLCGTSAVTVDAMKNDIDTFYRTPDCIFVGNVAMDQLDGEACNPGGAGNIPHKSADNRPVFQTQLFDEAPADETRRTRNEHSSAAERHAATVIQIGRRVRLRA